MTASEKALLATLALVVAIGFGWFVFGNKSTESVAVPFGGGFSAGEKINITAAGTGSSMEAGNPAATTTQAFLSTAGTASTTVQGFLGRSSILVLNAQSTGSSSAAVLNFSIDVSNDGVDWYPWNQATSTPAGSGTGTILNSPIEIVHQWNVATTSDTGNTVKKQFVFKDLFGEQFRIRFGTTGANQALWIETYGIEDVPR